MGRITKWLEQVSQEAQANQKGTYSYTVDELIEYAKKKPVITINLDELKHQYTTDRVSKTRMAKIVIDGYPIIVYRYADDGTLVTLDGGHRALKAIREGRKSIQAVLITDEDIGYLKKHGTFLL